MKSGYHHGNRRQALVDAVLDLIAAQGPTGFTLTANGGAGSDTYVFAAKLTTAPATASGAT